MAEVLITLGIIGVVAAITLPGLMHNIQMGIHKSQFKKAYSLMNNALNKAETDLGYDVRCSSTNISDCKLFHETFENNLKIAKKCLYDNAIANGCLADIKGFDEVYSGENTFVMFYKSNLSSRNGFVLANGISVIYYHRGMRLVYLIDTNGLQRPNKWGYDIFPLYYGNRKLYCPTTYKVKEAGGKTCDEMLME